MINKPFPPMRQDKRDEVMRLQARSGAERHGRAGAPRTPKVSHGQEDGGGEIPRGKKRLAKSMTLQAGVPHTRILKPKP